MQADRSSRTHTKRGRSARVRIGLGSWFLVIWLVSPLGTAGAAGGVEAIFDNGLPDGSFGALADIDNDQFVADDPAEARC